MIWWHDLRLGWKLLLSFAVVLAIVSIESSVSYRSILASQDAESWVEHTEQVISAAAQTRTALLDMQAGYRGFLISGDEAYLAPYAAGERAYGEFVAELEQLTADNPAQLQRWRELRAGVAAWQQEATEPGIQLRRSVTAGSASPDEIASFVRTGIGAARFETLRSILAEAISAEQVLLEGRRQEQNAARPRALRVIVGGTALAIGLGLALVFLAQRSITLAIGQVASAARNIAHRDLPALLEAVGAVAAGHLVKGARVTTPRLRAHGRDELGTMADDFNYMLDGLRDTDARLDSIVRMLAEQRDTLGATLEATPDAVIIVNAAFEPRLSNRRHLEWLGTSADELRSLAPGERARRAFARVEQPREFAAWAMGLLDKPEEIETRRVKFTAGPVSEADCFTAPVRTAGGAAVGRVFVYHDVSREAELARLKDELVSVVSHELRTPLASLVGFAELLLSREYSEAQRRKFLGVMADEGRRLAALVNDFLDLQRMESGRQQVAPIRADLSSMVARGVATLGEDAERPIRVDVPPALPLVRADPERIHQLLMNLLTNARKYSPQGGEIVITARCTGELVEVAVEDNGLGIPASAVPKLFTKFYRVDSSDRRAIKGTGLGLAIARQIVDAHGGRIWAESSGAGQGARFCFTLPVADTTSSEGDVLVVEDDPGFAQLLEAELAAVGRTAVRVASAEAALAYLGAARPCMIVLDLLLPGLHGEGFLQHLRATAGVTELPVVVVTVKELSADERRTLDDLRIIGVVRKGPTAAAEAASLVNGCMRGLTGQAT